MTDRVTAHKTDGYDYAASAAFDFVSKQMCSINKGGYRKNFRLRMKRRRQGREQFPRALYVRHLHGSSLLWLFMKCHSHVICHLTT